jgi:hypothetical protein
MLSLRTATTFDRLSLPRRLILSVCVAMLFFTGIAEAAHSCGDVVFHSWQHGHGSAERASGESGVCLTCITLQSATHAIALSAWAPLLVITQPIDHEELVAASTDRELAVYSRPPPRR